jgi:hypothetical protein
MSEISVYDIVPTPKLADKLIGTSVGGVIEDVTYNFTLQELLQLFIPNLPANNLQGVLNYGNTATQNINLTGTITTTNLSVLATANILNSNLSGNTRVMAGLFDRTNASGTAGQFLRSTGTQVEWFTIPTVIPTLQQVLTSGNTADRDIILTANITAVTATASNVVSNTALSVNGVLRDGTAAAGGSNQILSSTGSGVRWVDLPVYNVISPLLYNTTTKTFSIQPANGSQNGYLSSADWINFDGKQDAIILTTAGTSGAATFVGNTLNIPVYSPDLSGYVPISRTLSINGVTYDLSANRSWTIDAGVAEVTATAPLSSSGGAYPDISISQSSSSADGYLSSVDWLDFNSKQDGLNGTGLVKSTAGTITYITDNSSNWNTAYNDSIVSAAVTGTSTKTLTLNQQDGGTVTANWTDNGLTSVGVSMPSAFSVANSPLTSNGTIAITGAGTSLQYVDGTGALQTFPGLTGFVPYTGATTNVNLGVYSLTASSLIKSGGTSSQFLKADGSVDSSAYITLGSLSAASPLSYDNSIGAFSISQAGASTNGYLSSTDWNTFNNKQVAGNYITSLTGEATGTGPGATAVTLNNASVTGKVLTGVNITGGTVLATDTMLTAFGKLQNQINGLVGSTIYQGVWDASTNTPTLTSSVGTNGFYYIVNVAGSTNLNGITDWKIGDWAIFNGGVWQKVDNTESVTSVNGFTGAVSLTTDNIAQGTTNLYFANSLARTAVSLTTTGSSGVATYNNTTGVFNIPNYGSALSGYLPLTGGTLTGGLYINPANTAVVGLEVASDTIRLRSDSTQPFARQLTTTMGSGTLVKMQAAGFGGTYVTDLGFYTSSSSSLNTTPNLYLTGGNNRVGINTDVPAHTLDVVGTAGVSGVLTLGSTISNGTFTYTLPGATGTLALVGGAGVGTVTSVAALTLGTTGTDLSSTVANGTTTPVITLNVPTASATNRGALSSADWTTFNSKQATITLTTTSSSGASTFISNTLNVPNYTLEGLGGQPLATNLTSLSGLTFVSTSFVKMTAAGTFALDTNTYLTTASAASTYLPLAGGIMTGAITTPNNTFGIVIGDDSRLADRNVANTLFLEGVQNIDRGYINFSQTTGNALGAIDGGALTWRGVAIATTANISGTTNYVSKFTGANTLGNSLIQDDGTTVTSNGTIRVIKTSRILTIGDTYANHISWDSGVDLALNLDNGNTSGGIVFFGGTTTPKFTVTSSGAGTFAGSVTASGNFNALLTSGFILRNSTNTAAVGGLTRRGNWEGNATYDTALFAETGYGLYLYTNGSATPKILISTNGNTLIGTTTDAGYKLDVNGTGRFSGALRVNAASTIYGATQDAIQTIFTLGGQNASSQAKELYFRLTAGGTPAWTFQTAAVGTDTNINIFPNGTAGLTIAYAGAATFSSSVLANGLYANAGNSARFYRSANDYYWGINNDSNNYLNFGTFAANGTAYGTNPKLILLDNGNVGIGTTPSAWAQTALQIGNAGLASRPALPTLMQLSANQYWDGSSHRRISDGAATIYTQHLGVHNWDITASGASGSVINWTQVMTITSGSNVLIGTTTDNGFKLNVAGNAFAQTMDLGFLGLNVAGYNYYSQTISGAMGILGHNVRASGSVANQVNVVNGGWISSMIKQYYNEGITFHTDTTMYAGGAIYPMAATERMRITSGGNVLIGTASDGGYKLDVSGQVRAKGGNYNGFIADNSSSASIGGGFYSIQSFGSARGLFAVAGAIQGNVDNNVGIFAEGGSGMGGIKYYVGGSGTPSHMMHSNSNVTIGGISDGGGKLQIIEGGRRLSIGAQGYANHINWDSNVDLALNLNNGGTGAIVFFGGTTTARVTLAANGNVTAAAFFESSDATIKTLITDNYQAKGIESVVAKLYTKNGKEELGYYAQDVQSILPSAVSKGADGLLSLSYREVHTAKISALEKRVAELEQQLNLN